MSDMLGNVDVQDYRTSAIGSVPMDSLFWYSLAINLKIKSRMCD